jgi:hypothetical protein
MLATASEKGRGIQWFNQLPNYTATITCWGMCWRWLHSPRLCWLLWWLKTRIKLANGMGMLLALCPMIAHAARCRNHRLIARRTFVVAQFRITLLVRLAKLRPDIVFSLPHEHIWTLETKALDCLNRTVCAIRRWGKNWTICAIRGWGKNRTVCAICGCTCLLYNIYTMYSCF